MAEQRIITRQQLAKFLPDQESIRAFEALLKAVSAAIPADLAALQAEVTAAAALAGIADAAADAAQADATDAQTRVGVLETEIDVLSDVLQTVYVPQWDQVDPTTAYLGHALPGTATSAASWRIIRYTFSGDDIGGAYADGNASFDNVWDDRASLSYS